MISRRLAKARHTAVSIVLVVLALGCSFSSSGGDVPSDGSAARRVASGDEEVTLTVWDQEIREGQDAQISTLNEEFEKTYPNLNIDRVSRPFTDLRATLQDAITGGDLPDVVQVNQGWADMGQLVRGGHLLPLDDYAALYDWGERPGATLLDLNRWSERGEQFGAGSLFGVSQVAEVVGVYYNRSKLADLDLEVPKTFAAFEESLARAMSAGEIPIQFGNLDKWPAIHEFQVIQNQFAPKEYLRAFVLGKGDLEFVTKENKIAASTFSGWVREDFFTPGFQTLSYDDAWSRFADGEGLFLIAGSWLNRELDRRMGEEVGFFLMPPLDKGDAPVATGGLGLAFAITTDSPNADAAAAYIDFITNDHAMSVIAAAGGLPAFPAPVAELRSTSLLADVFDAWKTLDAADGLVPYLDYATPTFYGTLTASLQDLMAGDVSLADFLRNLNENYETFQALR